MPAAPEPFDEPELARLAGSHLARYAVVVLAVSGGADSMSLLELVRCWRQAGAPGLPLIHVATVDHGLRPQAATEAAMVADAARRLDLTHHTLKWHGAGTSTALQAAAREARYRLLGGLAAELSGGQPAAVVTGHHAGDQAETMLMRLARGSGLDGIAAMSPVRPLHECGAGDIDLVRPFLAFEKARLVAGLGALGRPWIEDPSNRNSAFERVRVRQAAAALEEAGIAPAAMALSATRLLRAKQALDASTTDLIAQTVDLHDGAFAELRAPLFDKAPAELRLRLLLRLWRGFAAPGPAVRLAQMEHLAGRLAVETPFAATLSGAHVRRLDDKITVTREPGRGGLPVANLSPGESTVWDGRFAVRAAPDAGLGLTVRALPAATLSALAGERQRSRRPAIPIPRAALLTLPSLWRADTLIGVLHPAFDAAPEWPVTARFVGVGG